ncbi:MAG TPA: hypothetical protein VHI72_04510 [Hyphomicrobiaceae bacterium]|nr:hypothetical protein [Hyphomicrobiaceae bacterium]
MRRLQQNEGFRIDVDLEHAQREAERVRSLLEALRRRHDLARYEYTHVVRIVPGSDTFAHPVLTLGNRFADSEDLLLSTYLHEQMHWYLWLLGTPEHDPVAPFFDELVRRYPEAPIGLPDGARNYESTYLHLVVNWLEIAATSTCIGRARAFACADAQATYRWIYKTVLKDWDLLAELYERHGLLPIQRADELRQKSVRDGPRLLNGGRKKTPAAVPRPQPPRSRRTPAVRGDRSAN